MEAPSVFDNPFFVAKTTLNEYCIKLSLILIILLLFPEHNSFFRMLFSNVLQTQSIFTLFSFSSISPISS